MQDMVTTKQARTEDDFRALVPLVREFYEEHGEPENLDGSPHATLRNYWLLRDSDKLGIFLGFKDEMLGGYFVVQYTEPWRGREFAIAQFFVRPGFASISKPLVQAGIDWAKQRGARRLLGGVSWQRAKLFARRFGFKPLAIVLAKEL